MCQLSALRNPRQPLVGISYQTFLEGVPEGNQLHRELLAKLFGDSDSRKQGILDWASFLQAMIVLRPNSLESRVESCLNLIRKKEKIYQSANGDQPPSKSMHEAVVSFEEIRMMCYLGLTQHWQQYGGRREEPANPYENMADYESRSVAAKHFHSLEAAMADIYARDFMHKMGYNLRETIPLQQFKEKLLLKRNRRESFNLIQPFIDHE